MNHIYADDYRATIGALNDEAKVYPDRGMARVFQWGFVAIVGTEGGPDMIGGIRDYDGRGLAIMCHVYQNNEWTCAMRRKEKW